MKRQKIIGLFFSLSYVLFIGACSKKETMHINTCADAGNIIKEALNYEGSIFYDELSTSYAIRYVVPGTYDQVLIGIICKIPEGLQKQEV